MVPFQFGMPMFGFLFSLIGLIVWLAVIWAIFDIRKQTRRTAEATERIAAQLSADGRPGTGGRRPTTERGGADENAGGDGGTGTPAGGSDEGP